MPQQLPNLPSVPPPSPLPAPSDCRTRAACASREAVAARDAAACAGQQERPAGSTAGQGAHRKAQPQGVDCCGQGKAGEEGWGEGERGRRVRRGGGVSGKGWRGSSGRAGQRGRGRCQGAIDLIVPSRIAASHHCCRDAQDASSTASTQVNECMSVHA